MTGKLYKSSVYKLFPSFYILFTAMAGLIYTLLLFSSCSAPSAVSEAPKKWVGTWSTAPQLVEERNMPPEPGLSHNTLRQILRVSIGGDSLRVKFSNEFSNSPVIMNSVHIAVSTGNSTIDTTSDQVLRFNGKTEVTIDSGHRVTSDPFKFKLNPRTNLAVTIYFGRTSPDVTGHPGSRTTSYIAGGNEVSASELPGAVQTDHWYIINGIDVLAPAASAAVVVLGNSITDGRGSGTNKQNRWPDELALRLQQNPGTQNIAVLNGGIGGNCVLRDCLGPSALSRFERDVLKQSGVRWLIILEGINDAGQSKGMETAAALINAYQAMIDSAHAKGIRVYGATLLPFGGSFYDSEVHEKVRSSVNEWIRNSGRFDAVIDLDAALRDPANPLQLLPAADSGDHLHPNETGHRMIAEAVDLTLFK